MKIVICGAGLVGESLAISLSGSGNQVVVLDNQQRITDQLARQVDVRTVYGDASDPKKLELAGTAEADALIAVTKSDEVNLICTQMAYTLFQVPLRIARLRGAYYTASRWQRFLQDSHMPTVVISPTRSIAQSIIHRLRSPQSSDAFEMMEGQVSILSFRCKKDNPLIGERLRDVSRYFPDMDTHVFALRRNRLPSLATGKTLIQEEDEIYLACPKTKLSRIQNTFGDRNQRNKQQYLIVGQTTMAYDIAQTIVETLQEAKISMIVPEESDPLDPNLLSERIRLYRGDPFNDFILQEADIKDMTAAISLLPQTESNFLTSYKVKQLVRDIRSLCLISNMSYEPIISRLGVDSGIDLQSIILSDVLQHVRKGRIQRIRPIFDQFGYLIEGVIPQNSAFIHQSLKELKPHLTDMRLVMIIRNGEIIIPSAETVILPMDRCLVFLKRARTLQAEKMFSVQL